CGSLKRHATTGAVGSLESPPSIAMYTALRMKYLWVRACRFGVTAPLEKATASRSWLEPMIAFWGLLVHGRSRLNRARVSALADTLPRSLSGRTSISAYIACQQFSPDTCMSRNRSVKERTYNLGLLR